MDIRDDFSIDAVRGVDATIVPVEQSLIGPEFSTFSRSSTGVRTKIQVLEYQETFAAALRTKKLAAMWLRKSDVTAASPPLHLDLFRMPSWEIGPRCPENSKGQNHQITGGCCARSLSLQHCGLLSSHLMELLHMKRGIRGCRRPRSGTV